MNILDTLVLQLTAKDLTFTSTLRTTEKALRAHVRAIEANGTRVLAAENKLMADAARITQSVLTPMEKYKNLVVELTSHLNGARISKTTWNRAMKESHAAIEALNPAIQRQNALLAHAEQLTTAMQSPMELYHRAMQRNTQALAAKYITTQTYIRAQQKLHNSLGHVQLAQQEESAAIQDGIRITTEMENHTERYAATLGLLGMRLRQRAIDQETYNRAVAAAVVTRDNADPAIIAARAAATQQQAQASAAAAAATAAHNAALADAAQITAANVSPLERYNAGLERAWRHWMADRIPLEDYRREVERLGREFDAQDPTMQARNRDQQRLNQIIQQGMTPQQRYNQAVAELGRIYRTTNMTAEQYRAAMNREYQLLPRVVEQERLHAERLREVAAMTERLRTPEEQRIGRLARLIQLQRTVGVPAETYRRELEAIGPASSIAAQRMAAMGAVFGRVGRRLTADGRRLAMYVTAPIVLLGTMGVREFAKFDDAMVKSFAIMKDLTTTTKDRMRDMARSMALDTIQSAADLGSAFYYLASAGLNAEQSMKALPVVTAFATAGMFDLAQATELLGDSQSALGLKVKDATKNAENMTRVSDVLVQAANDSQASVEQFAHALTNKAAAGLRNTSKEIEEGVAVLAAYADQGVKGEEAGEKLWMVLRDLQRASLDSADAWKKLKLEVYTTVDSAEGAAGTMRNLGDIVGDLEIRLSGMTDKQKRLNFEMLGFQDRSLSAIMSLIGVSAKIKDYEDRLHHVTGVTQRQAAEQLKSFGNQLKMTGNAIRELGMQIGETMAPWLKKLGEYIKGISAWFAKLTDNTQRWIVIIAAVTAAIGPLLIALGLLATALSAITVILSPWTLAFIAAGAAIAGFVLLLNNLGVAETAIHYKNMDMLKDGNLLRRSHIEQRDRLAELIGKQRLTNTEQEEAIGIIQDLEEKYGNLGVVLDVQNAKLKETGDALNAINVAMRLQAQEENMLATAEAIGNVKRLKEELEGLEKQATTMSAGGTSGGYVNPKYAEQARLNQLETIKGSEQYKEALKKVKEEEEKILYLQTQATRLGTDAGLTGRTSEVQKKHDDAMARLKKSEAEADKARESGVWGDYVDEFFVGENEIAKAVENVTNKLHAQIDAYKQGHAAVMVATLARKGATEEQLKPARELLATLKEMELASAVDKIKEETKYLGEKGHALQRLKFIEQGYSEIQLKAFNDAATEQVKKADEIKLREDALALVAKYTPKLVKLAEAEKRLGDMLDKKLITLDQYRMAIKEIQDDIDEANKKAKLDLSPTNVTAVEKDSAEAIRMFYEYMRDRKKINDAGNAQQIKDAQKTADAVAAAANAAAASLGLPIRVTAPQITPPPGAPTLPTAPDTPTLPTAPDTPTLPTAPDTPTLPTAPDTPTLPDPFIPPPIPLLSSKKAWDRAGRRHKGYDPIGSMDWETLALVKQTIPYLGPRSEPELYQQRKAAAAERRGGKTAYDPLAKMKDGPAKEARLAARASNKDASKAGRLTDDFGARARQDKMMEPIRKLQLAQQMRGHFLAEKYAKKRINDPEFVKEGLTNNIAGREKLREKKLLESQTKRWKATVSSVSKQQKMMEDVRQRNKGNVQDKEGKWVSPAQQQDKKEKEQQKTLETIAANTDPKNMPRPVVLVPANVRSL